MNGFPLFALTTRLKDPGRLPGNDLRLQVSIFKQCSLRVGGVEIVTVSNDMVNTPTLLLKVSQSNKLSPLS